MGGCRVQGFGGPLGFRRGGPHFSDLWRGMLLRCFELPAAHVNTICQDGGGGGGGGAGGQGQLSKL